MVRFGSKRSDFGLIIGFEGLLIASFLVKYVFFVNFNIFSNNYLLLSGLTLYSKKNMIKTNKKMMMTRDELRARVQSMYNLN